MLTQELALKDRNYRIVKKMGFNCETYLREQVTMLPFGIMTASSHSAGNLATVNFTGTGHCEQQRIRNQIVSRSLSWAIGKCRELPSQ